jgi:hypothetical protein
MGKHETGYQRVARDLYPTRERWITEALLAHVDIGGRKVWECAAGTGCMAEVLKTAAPAKVYCSDITDYGYPLDALLDFTVIVPDLNFDAIITNPPGGDRNKLAEKFITIGLSYIARGGLLALLLPMDFASAVTRRALFDDCPFYTAKIVLTKRPKWFESEDKKDKSPKENYAWYIWEHSALRIKRHPIELYAHAERKPRSRSPPRPLPGQLRLFDKVDGPLPAPQPDHVGA